MTQAKAKEVGLKLWGWLAEVSGRTKLDYIAQVDSSIHYLHGYCPLCEAILAESGLCEGCPLVIANFSCVQEPNGIYRRWKQAIGLGIDSTVVAKEIYRRIELWTPKEAQDD